MKLLIALVSSLAASGAQAVQLFSSPGALPTSIPASCRAALSTNITCPLLVPAQYIENQLILDQPTLGSLCTPGCASSLMSFQTRVDNACGDTEYSFTNVTTQSGRQIADPLAWAYNVTCLQSGGMYCAAAVKNGTIGPCADCTLKYIAAMMGSVYGLQRFTPPVFSSLLSSCSSPASKYPYTLPSATTATLPPSTTTSSSLAAGTTCLGSNYTVKAGDTCKSIASANSIAYDRFINDNRLDMNCTTLTTGRQVCLGLSCKLATVQSGNTCDTFVSNQTFYLAQFLSWNPVIYPNCGNIGSLVGHSVCVSPPGTSSWQVNATTTSTTTVTYVVPPTSFGSLPAQTGQTNYSTSLFIPATPTAINTTTVSVNASYVTAFASAAQYCPFNETYYDLGITPNDMPDNCTSALNAYCFPNPNKPFPTSTSWPWSCLPQFVGLTASPTPVTTTTSSALPPTQTGIAANCNKYYLVQQGDTCQIIVSEQGTFTLTDFYKWNPAVGNQCQTLLVGYRVCVGVSS